MTAEEYFKHCHGDAQYLSKDSIIVLMNLFSDHRFEGFKEKRERFNSEQWMANEIIKRGKFPKR